MESYRTKLVRIERTLSGSILRASQTDFRFDPLTEQLQPEPFVEDLELFHNAQDMGIRQLIENASTSADEIIPKLDGANIEQRYFADALRIYSQQCKRIEPNPRVLERKGSLVRFVLNSEGVDQTVHKFLLKEIEQFVEIHNELMRGYFGHALSEIRAVQFDKVRDNIIDVSPDALADASKDLLKYVGEPNVDGGKVSEEAHAILADVHSEVDELSRSVDQTNDPSLKALRLARAKVAAVHGALFVGRIIFRVAGASLEFGSRAATIAMLVELTNPGSLRAAYEILRLSIPDLPALPKI